MSSVIPNFNKPIAIEEEVDSSDDPHHTLPYLWFDNAVLPAWVRPYYKGGQRVSAKKGSSWGRKDLHFGILPYALGHLQIPKIIQNQSKVGTIPVDKVRTIGFIRGDATMTIKHGGQGGVGISA